MNADVQIGDAQVAQNGHLGKRAPAAPAD